MVAGNIPTQFSLSLFISNDLHNNFTIVEGLKKVYFAEKSNKNVLIFAFNQKKLI